MKPEGNRVGSCVSWNAKPQRPIGYKEEAKAKLFGCLLLDAAGRPRSCEASEPASGTNL
jgi:hypothetical protein